MRFLTGFLAVMSITALTAIAGPEKYLSADFEVLNLKGKGPAQEIVFKDGGLSVNSTFCGPGIKQVSGPDGMALQLIEENQIVFPPSSIISQWAGEMSCKLRFDFDPTARTKENKMELRNQAFWYFRDSKSGISGELYSCLHNICFRITNRHNKMTFYVGAPAPFKGNQWYDIKVRWGNEIVLYVDGIKLCAKKNEGFFGPQLVESFSLFVGAGRGRGIKNKFSIDSLKYSIPEDVIAGTAPKVTLPLVNDRPVLDGKLDDAFWQNATELTGFVMNRQPKLINKQPQLYVAYNDDGIYIGLKAIVPGGTEPKASLKKRDSGVYSEDGFEIRFISEPQKIYAFLFNAIGTQFDSITKFGSEADVTYDPDWQVKTVTANGYWTAEALIPWKALGHNGKPKTGDTWRGNFCIDSVNGFYYAGTWAFTNVDFNDPTYFGEVMFSGGPRALRFEKIIDFIPGNPELLFKLCGPFPPVMNLKGFCYDDNGMQVANLDYPLRDTTTGTFKPGFLNPGTSCIKIEASDVKTEYFRQMFFFKPDLSITLSADNYPYNGYAKFELRASKYAANAEKAEITLLTSEDKSFSKQTVELKKGVSSGTLETEKLVPGKYIIFGTILDSTGKTLDSAKTELTIYPKPDWWKNSYGIDHTVPPPWTPLTRTKTGLSVWGREFIFDGKVFPEQILNQQKAQFAGIPSLKVNGQEILNIKAETIKPFADEVITLGSRSVSGLDVKVTGKLEFDGCFRYDFTINPGKQSGEVKSLTFEMNIDRKLASHILTSNGTNGSVSPLTETTLLPFTPKIWLGNYDQGLCLFFESDQYWTPNGRKNAVRVIPQGNTVKLCIDYVVDPLKINAPAVFTLGLMPTPVKPLESHDPFRFTKWNAEKNVSRHETMPYPELQNLSSAGGCLEFFLKRDESAGKTYSELFFMKGQKGNLVARISQKNQIYLDWNRSERLITASTPVDLFKQFYHVAFSWSDGKINLYIDGRLIDSVEEPKGFQDVIKDIALGKGELAMGGLVPSPSQSDIIVDELRISKTPRYTAGFTPPSAPFKTDADTLRLDHLDDKFRPDGSDAYTSSGGVPSLGCKFVPGKFGSALAMVSEKMIPGLEVQKAIGNKIFLAWNWHTSDSIEMSWPPILMDKVSKQTYAAIETARQQGWISMPYLGFPAIGGPSEVEKQFGAEWANLPLNKLPYPPPQGHYMLYVSMAAPGNADYLAAGTKWALEKVGFDGIYTDGCGHVYPTANDAYGCGWTDVAGKRHPTWPFFATRECMKRMYKIVKKHNAEGLVVNHVSYSIEIPVMSFSDIHYTGEHEDYENLDNSKIRFRREPWGIECKLLGASSHEWSPLHTAIGLLHGTSIWGYGVTGRDDMCRKFMNIRVAFNKFGFNTAQWIPYFEGENIFYKDLGEKTKVSTYLHKGKDALLIVANLDKEMKTIQVDLMLKAMGLEGENLEAVNALTDVAVPITKSGVMSVTVRPKSFVLVHLK